jgi:hypothetical protein
LSICAVITSVAAAFAAIRAPHTRALGAALAFFAVTALARIAAWQMATVAADTINGALFGASRYVSTAAILLGTAGQLVIVTWLGSRGRMTGQVAALAALGLALVVTLGVARGMHSGAAMWQAVVHTALADAPGVPPPYGLDALATFLVPSSLLLGLAAASLAGQVVGVVAAMSLLLVSRGWFDAPLCALCAVAAAEWAALASTDERALWSTLLGDRKRRLDEASELGESGKGAPEHTASAK